METYPYTIKNGDYLGVIANKEGVTVDQILAVNPGLKKSSVLQIGQVINIPGTGPDLNSPRGSFNDNREFNSWQPLYIPAELSETDTNEQNEVLARKDNLVLKQHEALLLKQHTVHCPVDIEEILNRPVKKIRISVFFDGTGNNRANTKLGKNKEDFKKFKDEDDYFFVPRGVFDEHASFYNDKTNVVRLEEMISPDQNGFDLSESIYIEGIGTRNNETLGGEVKAYDEIKNDIYAGMSEGEGPTGITGKVQNGINEVIDLLKEKFDSLDTIEVAIDVFGFSRGAAAARNFIYEIKGNPENTLIKMMHKESSMIIDKVDIKFVGLFDSVSALGSIFADTNKYEDTGMVDDVKLLNLDIFKTVEVEKVVHLCAAEEYRNAFKLINIKSAVDKGNGIEIFLPGAHSDIGGSYVDKSGEGNIYTHQLLDLNQVPLTRRDNGLPKIPDKYYTTKELNELIEIDKKWLISQGWYNENKDDESKNEIEISKNFHYINGNRKSIRNTYSYIPLQIMHDFAKDSGLEFKKEVYNMENVDFTDPTITSFKSYRLKAVQNIFDKDKVLEAVYDNIFYYINDHRAKNGADYWRQYNGIGDLWPKLRHNYLHFSAYFYQFQVSSPTNTRNYNFLKPLLRKYDTPQDIEKIKRLGIRTRANVNG